LFGDNKELCVKTSREVKKDLNTGFERSVEDGNKRGSVCFVHPLGFDCLYIHSLTGPRKHSGTTFRHHATTARHDYCKQLLSVGSRTTSRVCLSRTRPVSFTNESSIAKPYSIKNAATDNRYSSFADGSSITVTYQRQSTGPRVSQARHRSTTHTSTAFFHCS
jgi:hypothetical protein